MRGTRHRLQNRDKMTHGKITPFPISAAYLTNGGNLLSQTPSGWTFVSPLGQIVGFPDDTELIPDGRGGENTELEWLLEVCPEITLSKPIWLKQPRTKVKNPWYVIATYRVAEDFSRYKWATSSNGGDYGFWTTRTVFARKRGDRVEIGYVDSQRTTADFGYTDDGVFEERDTMTVWATDVVGGFAFTTRGYHGDCEDQSRPLEKFEWFVRLPDFDGNLPAAQDGLETPSRREVVSALQAVGLFLSSDRAFAANWWGARPRFRKRNYPSRGNRR